MDGRSRCLPRCLSLTGLVTRGDFLTAVSQSIGSAGLSGRLSKLDLEVFSMPRILQDGA